MAEVTDDEIGEIRKRSNATTLHRTVDSIADARRDITALLAYVAALKAERDEARARVATLEHRLEIDRYSTLDPNDPDKFIEHIVPAEDRDKQIDGISCRDATIALLDEELKAAESRLASLSGEVETEYEAVPPYKLAEAFGVSTAAAKAAIGRLGFLYRQLAARPSSPSPAPDLIAALEELLQAFPRELYDGARIYLALSTDLVNAARRALEAHRAGKGE